MKRIAIIIMAVFIILLTGCTEEAFYSECDFDEAVISNFDETSLQVEIAYLIPYTNGQYMIVSTDGNTYLADKKNVMLVRYRDE